MHASYSKFEFEVKGETWIAIIWRYDSKAAGSNRAAGVATLPGPRAAKLNIVEVAGPPAELQGRGGLVRLKASRQDLTIINVYPPPIRSQFDDIHAIKNATKWPPARTAIELCKWAAPLLICSAKRATPIMVGDFNVRMGLTFEERWTGFGDYHKVECKQKVAL